MQGQSQVQGGKIDVRIISDDVVSPVLPPLTPPNCWMVDLFVGGETCGEVWVSGKVISYLVSHQLGNELLDWWL